LVFDLSVFVNTPNLSLRIVSASAMRKTEIDQDRARGILYNHHLLTEFEFEFEPPVNYDILSPQILPFKRLRTHIPNDLPSVLLDVQKLTHENLLAHKKMLDAQIVSDRAR
jgi:hypothetical protein